MEYNDYDPVADLYDIYVPVDFDIPFFLRHTLRSGEVLELMSGTGRVSIPLLEAGVKLTCVDLSAELNTIFKRKLDERGLAADVYQIDVCELDLPKQFEQVIIPFHSFAHLTTVESQRKAFQRIQQHLPPMGTFILTLGNPAVRQQAVDGQLRLLRKYAMPEDQGTLLLWVLERPDSQDARVVDALQFYEEYSSHGVLKAKRMLELHFRLSSREEIEALAVEIGYKVKAFYGDYSGAEFQPESSPFMIWIFENAC